MPLFFLSQFSQFLFFCVACECAQRRHVKQEANMRTFFFLPLCHLRLFDDFIFLEWHFWFQYLQKSFLSFHNFLLFFQFFFLFVCAPLVWFYWLNRRRKKIRQYFELHLRHSLTNQTHTQSENSFPVQVQLDRHRRRIPYTYNTTIYWMRNLHIFIAHNANQGTKYYFQ